MNEAIQPGRPSRRSGRPSRRPVRPGSPRSSADSERTRNAILRAAAALAVQDGLEGLSIAGVAAAVGIPKSGLHAYFGSKTDLQLAIVAEAARIFAAEVVRAAPPGLGQLTGVCEAFFAHLERRTFPGGSFMTGTALEMGTRPGPVNELIREHQSAFGTLLRGFAATALAQGELPGSEDPARLAVELNGIIAATDTNFVQHDDPAVLQLARQIIHQRLEGA
jgi:AcrR family transcriptional regulator